MRRGKLIAEFLRFLHDSKGATAIEYALIAAGVSVAIIGGVTSLGSTVNNVFYQKLTVVINGSGS
jgi:pilus assembly protein Flp/PilA